MTTNNDFDPNNFDWDEGGSGIPLSDIGENVIEECIQAALFAEEQAFGWARLKRDDVKQTSGRVFRVKYVVPKELHSVFEETWPEYTFIWDCATCHHDHPASHLATELNELEMVHDLVSKGLKYVDLFGNPHRNRKYKRKAITAYELAAPKDYLRYQYESAALVRLNWDDLINRRGIYSDVDTITCTHALYYLDMARIGQLVNRDSRTRLRALVHRHEFTHGFLNAGELEYWVDPAGTVRQRNVLTGEEYKHPSLEGLFHQGSAVTEFGGIAWTVRKVGLDTYLFDFVGCPEHGCEVWTPLSMIKPESRSVEITAGVKVHKFLHWTWTTIDRGGVPTVLEDCDLLQKLRRYCAGKKRDVRVRTEMMNYARRLCNKADIISIHGGGAHEIPEYLMVDYVEAAFYMDVKHELEVVMHHYAENKVFLAALNAHYDGDAKTIDFAAVEKLCSKVNSLVLAPALKRGIGSSIAFHQELLIQRHDAYGPFAWSGWAG